MCAPVALTLRAGGSVSPCFPALTIPAWMEEELRKREDVNVSLILQEALKKELKIKEPVSF